MSLILEALKKSEQQRQQKNSTQQQVRKRTLSLSSPRSGRRAYYWLLAGLVALVFLGAGWFYSNMQGISAATPAVASAPEAPSAASQPKAVEPATQPAEANNTPLQTPPVGKSQAEAQPPMQAPAQAAVTVEPAPVPREFVETQEPLPRIAAPTPDRSTPKKSREPVAQQRTAQVVAPAAVQPTETPVTSTPQPSSMVEDGSRLPLYKDLSEELRARMPDLNMSMHFYAKDPDRRLVRINGRLLREGARLSDDLELVEITPSGVTLDFLGKVFALSSSGR